MPGTLRQDDRPPIKMDAAPAPDVTAALQHVRPTARPRPWVTPLPLRDDAPGHAPDDPAVRRYWTAVVGPSAVADLLRITAAARDLRRIRKPIHLATLAREGLCYRRGDIVLVSPRIPHLAPHHLRRLQPALRAEYRAILATQEPAAS